MYLYGAATASWLQTRQSSPTCIRLSSRPFPSRLHSPRLNRTLRIGHVQSALSSQLVVQAYSPYGSVNCNYAILSGMSLQGYGRKGTASTRHAPGAVETRVSYVVWYISITFCFRLNSHILYQCLIPVFLHSCLRHRFVALLHVLGRLVMIVPVPQSLVCHTIGNALRG